MVRVLKNEINVNADGAEKSLAQIACLSTDTKPTSGLATGSIALEVDTGDVYAFDEVSGDWTKIN